MPRGEEEKEVGEEGEEAAEPEVIGKDQDEDQD